MEQEKIAEIRGRTEQTSLLIARVRIGTDSHNLAVQHGERRQCRSNLRLVGAVDPYPGPILFGAALTFRLA